MARTKFHYDLATGQYLTQDGRTMAEAGVKLRQDAARRTDLTLTEHLLCLVATVITFGLFLPVWIYLAARGKAVAP